MCSALLFTLQVWMLLRYLWSNHLRIPIFLNNKPCVKNKLLALSCQEIDQYVSCVRFFTSREGVVGILPNFWAAFTHPYVTSFTHPNAGVSIRVHRKHWTGHNNPNQFDQSVNCGWLFSLWLHPVESMSTCRPCPDFKSEWPQKKEWSVKSVDQFNSFRCCSFNCWCQFSDVIFPYIVSFIGVCSDINFEMYNSMAYTTATNVNNQKTTTRFYP